MAEPRITGGKARGIRLQVPKSGTRPATDFLREALFSHLGTRIEGSCLYDFFSGTGAYGLEGISRGASTLSAFDNDAAANRCLRTNADRLKKAIQANPPINIYKENILSGSFSAQATADMIFIDPPYELYTDGLEPFLDIAIRCLKQDGLGIIAIEHPAELETHTESLPLELKRRLGGKKGTSPALSIFYKNA